MTQKCGLFHESYDSDMGVFPTWFVRGALALLFVWLAVFPFVAKPIGKVLGTNVLYLANLIGIYIIGAHGLNILTGYTGQISLGHGAFMGVGAFASAILTMRLGLPFWVALPLAGLVTALVGMFFGIPSLRLKGLYLAIATMAAQFIIQYTMRNWDSLTGGSGGMSVRPPTFFGTPLNSDFRYYWLVWALVIAATVATKNLTRTRPGRAFVAIRDRYLSAEVMGVNVWGYRILSFGVSSFMVGISGSLWAHYVMVISDEHFGIGLSVQYLASIIIGGLGSVTGAIYGALFMTLLPELLRIPERALGEIWSNAFTIVNYLREGTFGLLVVLFIIFEPDGIAHRWQKIKAYWKLWPFSYYDGARVNLRLRCAPRARLRRRAAASVPRASERECAVALSRLDPGTPSRSGAAAAPRRRGLVVCSAGPRAGGAAGPTGAGTVNHKTEVAGWRSGRLWAGLRVRRRPRH